MLFRKADLGFMGEKYKQLLNIWDLSVIPELSKLISFVKTFFDIYAIP